MTVRVPDLVRAPCSRPASAWGRAALWLALTCGLGCPADDDGDDVADTSSASETEAEESTASVPVVDYMGEVQPIWDAACTCHLQGSSGTMVATVLTLNADVSYEELVEAPAMEAALSRVEPGDLDASYLWHKLEGTQASVAGSGDPMPQIGMLTAEQRETIRAWIEGGAPP